MFAAFRRKIINSVFLTFKESLLAFNHCDKLLTSWLNFLAKSSSDLPDCRIFVSSAKWYALEYLTHLCRFFMYIRKRSGLTTEPWGTSVKFVLVVELQLLIDTNCFLFVIEELNHFLKCLYPEITWNYLNINFHY